MRLKDSSLIYKVAGVIRFFIARAYHGRRMTSTGLSLFATDTTFLIENNGHVSLGNRIILANSVFIQSNGSLRIGNNFFVNSYSRIVCHESIEIGDSVTLASGVAILDHDHNFKVVGNQRIADGYVSAPVRIGSNVWIGDRVVVLKGVTIGDNVTIGAGSVVVNDLPDNVVAVGVPAKVVSTH